MTSPVRDPHAAGGLPPHSVPSHETTSPSTDGVDFVVPPPAQVSKSRAVVYAALGLSVLGAAFLARFVPSRVTRQALEAETHARESSMPRVQVVSPTVAGTSRSLALPGSVQPLEETVLYPRANGYVKRWVKDLGEHVDEGELLAEIDTPDLDQQIAQARATLAQAEASLQQARANANFSKESLARYQQLLPAGLASQQDFDKARAQADVDKAAVGVADANIGAQRANLQYLGQLKTFARVVAPFAGIVTARNVERGTLVTSGTATPLFRVTAADPVRVFVQVPQDVAPGVRTEVAANVTVREYPNRTFAGKVAHAAGALDASTRTMSTEVRVPNPKGELLSGMYAQVSISLPNPHQVLSIPGTAVLNDAGGVRVAVVGPGDKIHLVPVVIERDTGPTVEIASGLTPEDKVVKLPSGELGEGRQVEVAH